MADKSDFDNKAFVVYKDWEKCINCLRSDVQVGKLFRALFAYANRGEKPDFGCDDGFLGLFTMMAMVIDRDSEKWEKKRKARIEAGKKGGRPKKDISERQELEAAAEDPTAPDLEGQLSLASPEGSFTDQSPPISDTAESDKGKPPKIDRRKRYPFGQYGNVLLTMPKYERLVADFGDKKTAEYIRRVDEYVQQHGRSYSDYDVSIRKWIREDSEKESVKSEGKKKKEGQNSSFNIEDIEDMLFKKSKDPAATTCEVLK